MKDILKTKKKVLIFCLFVVVWGTDPRAFPGSTSGRLGRPDSYQRHRRMLRRHHAVPRSSEGYGLHLGEFLWRSRFVSRGKAGWRRRAFFELIRAFHATCPAERLGDSLEPMQFDPWFADTFGWLKEEYAAPKIRCRRGRRPIRPSARPRRNPQEVSSASRPAFEPIEDALAADLEDVIDEETRRSRKRPPSPLPIADAGSTSGVLTGTGRVRRVRRRRDLPTAYMQVYSRETRPSAPPPPPADVEPHNIFTPVCVTDGSRCLARTWNAGRGGQCAAAPERDSEAQVCARHRLPAQQAHGLVTGAIPPVKLAAFRKSARGTAIAQVQNPSQPDPPSAGDGEDLQDREGPRTPGNDAEDAIDEPSGGRNNVEHSTPSDGFHIGVADLGDVADLFAQSDSEDFDGNVPLVPCGGCGNAKRPVDPCTCSDCPFYNSHVPVMEIQELPRGMPLLRRRATTSSEPLNVATTQDGAERDR